MEPKGSGMPGLFPWRFPDVAPAKNSTLAKPDQEKGWDWFGELPLLPPDPALGVSGGFC